MKGEGTKVCNKTIPEGDFQICHVCIDKDGSQSVNQSRQWY